MTQISIFMVISVFIATSLKPTSVRFAGWFIRAQAAVDGIVHSSITFTAL